MRKRIILLLVLIVLNQQFVQAQTYDIPIYIYEPVDRIEVDHQMRLKVRQLLEKMDYNNFVIFQDRNNYHGVEINLRVLENDKYPEGIYYASILSRDGIQPKNNILNDISSMLYNHIPSNVKGDIIISFTDDSSIESVANFVHLTIQYLQHNCEPLIKFVNQQNLQNLHLDGRSGFAFMRGNCALLEQDYQTATSYFDLSTNFAEQELHPVYVNQTPYSIVYSIFHLAWTYVQMGYEERAIETMNLLVERKKYSPFAESNARTHRAEIYALIFDYTAAIQDLDEAIALIKTEHLNLLSQLFKQRGDIIMLIYEWNRALEDYNTAIELDPDYAEAYYRRGILLYTMVEREDAIADFETYLEIVPDGQFAESASKYIEDIQTELDALGG
jgi:tetratricopeptide (TPR) repeat protein